MGQLVVANLRQKSFSAEDRSIPLDENTNFVLAAYGKSARYLHFINRLKNRENLRIVTIVSKEDVSEFAIQPAKSHIEVATLKQVLKLFSELGSTGETPDSPIGICLDVSCMSRSLMGALIASVKALATRHRVELKLIYTLTKFNKPPENWSTVIRRIGPVHPEFAGWTSRPELPVAVIVALGYERGKATGAVEYLEPRDKWIYVPNSPEKRFLHEVETQNKKLLADAVGHRLDYDVTSPVDAYHSMLSLVRGMQNLSRPILLPFGPRIFFALSLLVTLLIEEASVWYVDGENTESTDNLQPSGNTVLFSCRIEYAET